MAIVRPCSSSALAPAAANPAQHRFDLVGLHVRRVERLDLLQDYSDLDDVACFAFGHGRPVHP
ncbi:MAG: hypothetical protein GEU87_04140 [Alphaproteobacteria bacterium]|nr:hypothetical protein [Alphaproteobacteria bacterium]